MNSPDQKPNWQEKRKYPRFNKDVSIKFKLANSTNDFREAVSENISKGGVMFEVMQADEPLKQGHFIEMELKGAPASELVKMIARIVWIKDSKFSMKLRLGIQFLGIIDDNQIDFDKLIEE